MFLLDSNVFIEAKDRYYGFDFAPGFWAWLDFHFKSGRILSIQDVRDELIGREDDLSLWVREHKQYFRSTSESVTLEKFGEVNNWAVTHGYPQEALQVAQNNPTDFMLVAYAAAHDLVVVTHEKSAPQSKKRVMIPDACKAVDVKVTDTFTMLQETEIRLIIEDPPNNVSFDQDFGVPDGVNRPLPGM